MIIIVSGTPGTGKTVIAKFIAKRLPAQYIDVNALIKDHHLSRGYDRRLKTRIVNIERLNRFLIQLIRNARKTKHRRNLVIDSHLGHYLPRRYVDLCFITTCPLKTLRQRLMRRKYSKEKIQENINAEIFEVCLLEAASRKHKVVQVDTSPSSNWRLQVTKIIKTKKI